MVEFVRRYDFSSSYKLNERLLVMHYRCDQLPHFFLGVAKLMGESDEFFSDFDLQLPILQLSPFIFKVTLTPR